MGEYLEHTVAMETNALKPPHQYVPWFTVNGQHTEDMQDEVSRGLLKYVCKVYKGTKPKVCHMLIHNNNYNNNIDNNSNNSEGMIHGMGGKVEKCYREFR